MMKKGQPLRSSDERKNKKAYDYNVAKRDVALTKLAEELKMQQQQLQMQQDTFMKMMAQMETARQQSAAGMPPPPNVPPPLPQSPSGMPAELPIEGAPMGANGMPPEGAPPPPPEGAPPMGMM